MESGKNEAVELLKILPSIRVSDADSETVDLRVKETDHTVTHVTTTTVTGFEERKTVDAQKAELSTAAREGIVQPRQDVSTFSQTTADQQRHETQFSVQSGVQRKTSFYQETRIPTVAEGFSSTPKAVETRRILTPQKSTYSSARERFRQIERLHREEKDHIIALMTDEHEDYKRSCEEQFEALQTENERLRREISASTSLITMLEIQLNDGHPGTASRHDKVDSNFTTITTTITTITTTLTTLTTRIEHWKRAVAMNKGQVTISNKELEQLSLDLSTTSSQITELQQRYAQLSRDFGSVHYELQVTSSSRDEKDRTITSLTAEVAQWKTAEAAARRDNESLRRDLSATSSRTAELQQRCDAQSSELASTRNELQTFIEERDRTVASFTAEVARWKQSDATKAEQIASSRRDYEKLQRDLSASSSKSAALQTHYDAQSQELGSVRNELQVNNSLLEEKERTITTLTAAVNQWKRTDTAKAEQIAAEHRDKEKLQLDLTSFSSQTADLQKRYDAQSKDIVSIRNELQAKVSLLEEKERTVSSLIAEVAQAKREDSMKAEQLTTARRDVERLRLELSSASTQSAALQKRYEAQSKELNSVRDELHQIEILYPDGTDQAPVEPSEHAVSQHIARALEKKNRQMEELRRDLAASTNRNAELQKSYEKLSREVSTVRDEFKVKTSQHEGAITSFTAQVEQWKRADTTKAERIATTLKQIEKLQQDLATSTSQLTELQGRYETQSREFITVRNELQSKTSSNEDKDLTIASLTAEVDQRKRADANKTEQIAITLKQVEKLQRDLSASASKLTELQSSYETQSRELTSVRNELQTKTSLHEGKDHTISSLTVELDQWKRADTKKAEQIATTLKQVEKLQRDLSASTSQLGELQGHYEAQSHELQSRTSSNEDKDRAVAALTVQVEKWKRTDALKEERIVTIRKEAEDLQRKVTNSSSQIAELQQRYDMQSKQLISLQDQFQDKVSGSDRAVSSLISQVEEWKHLDATKAKELTTARTDIEELRRNLATSSSQIIELQKRYETRSTEFTSQTEDWKRSDATKTEELTTARKDLEQLRRDLSTSSSQIIEYQQRCAAQSAQSAELTSQIEQWKRSDAAKAEGLATAREKLGQLQHDLTTSSSRITEFQQRYEAQSTELTSLREQLQTTSSLGGEEDRIVATLNVQIDQWKRANSAKAEELARAHTDLEQLQRKLSASSSHIDELQKYHAEQLDALRKSSLVSEESRKVYEKITTEVKDYAAVIKLTTTIDQWLRADSKRAEDLALELERRNKENEELRHHLVTLKEIYIRAPELKQIFQSETIEIQRHYEEQSKELESALAERQSQLDGVQRFVTTADKYADEMITQILHKLNAEVQQSTTFMAEYMLEDFRPRAAKLTKEQISAVQRVSESIGQILAGCLGRKERDDVALYLPIALQAYITYHLHWLISSWTVERGYNDLINKTYEQLQKSGKKSSFEYDRLLC